MKDSRLVNRMLFLLPILLLLSCNNGLSPKEYQDFVKESENGLIKKKSISDIWVELQYKPVDLVALDRMEDKEDFEKKVTELSGLQYYDMRLGVEIEGRDITNFKANKAEDIQRMLHYLSFGLKDDIRLVQGMDTLKTELYHFERSYDIVPHRTFLLAFKAKDNNENRKLILDSPVFGTGPIKIGIKGKDISNIPELKL